jgi:hypothetical protein
VRCAEALGTHPLALCFLDDSADEGNALELGTDDTEFCVDARTVVALLSSTFADASTHLAGGVLKDGARAYTAGSGVKRAQLAPRQRVC